MRSQGKLRSLTESEPKPAVPPSRSVRYELCARLSSTGAALSSSSCRAFVERVGIRCRCGRNYPDRRQARRGWRQARSSRRFFSRCPLSASRRGCGGNRRAEPGSRVRLREAQPARDAVCKGRFRLRLQGRSTRRSHEEAKLGALNEPGLEIRAVFSARRRPSKRSQRRFFRFSFSAAIASLMYRLFCSRRQAWSAR